MRHGKWFAQGLGIGLGIAFGAALFGPLGSADALPTVEKLETRLDKRMAKLMKAAQRKGTAQAGLVVGIVTSNRDPEELGRVRVRYPWMDEEEASAWWARPVAPAPGVVWTPEVGDEVLVAFAHGDVRRPFVLGLLSRPR